MVYFKGKKMSEIDYIKEKFKNSPPISLEKKIKELEEKIKRKKEQELRKKEYLKRKKKWKKIREKEEKEKEERLQERKLQEKAKEKICRGCEKTFHSRHKKQIFCNIKCMHQFHNKKKLKRLKI